VVVLVQMHLVLVLVEQLFVVLVLTQPQISEVAEVAEAILLLVAQAAVV
jgi:hypothetical protein